MPGKRKYEMKRRAERKQETRRRIVDAALELHATVGPVRASYAAIAELAGVERRTVYNHFPAEADLFRACSSAYRATNPFPDPDPWKRVAAPEERLRTGLDALYAHYRQAESRWTNILRDAEVDPLVRQGAEYRFEYLRKVRDVLAVGWGVRGRRRAILLQALGFAVDFHAWRSLASGQGVDHDNAVELMVGLVRHAAGACADATDSTSADGFHA